MTIWMLVSINPVRLLGSVFWTAITIVAVKLIVSQLLRRNTQNVLARFVEIIRIVLMYFVCGGPLLCYFLGEMPSRMPL